MSAPSLDRTVDWLVRHPRVLTSIYVTTWLAGAVLLTLARYGH